MIKKITGIACLVHISLNLYFIFFQTPVERYMGITQKIMYIHVPSIITAYVALGIAFFCSVFYLWKRQERFDIIAYAAMETGAVFCALALITGSIWGKPTWNTYWTWDARLTLTLILFLIFIGYLLLRKFTGYGEQQARISAVIAIIGTLDIPLIHLSVVWWRTLHQPSTILSTQKNVIDQPLMFMLVSSIIAFWLLLAYLIQNRVMLEMKTRAYYRKVAELYAS